MVTKSIIKLLRNTKFKIHKQIMIIWSFQDIIKYITQLKQTLAVLSKILFDSDYQKYLAFDSRQESQFDRKCISVFFTRNL